MLDHKNHIKTSPNPTNEAKAGALTSACQTRASVCQTRAWHRGASNIKLNAKISTQKYMFPPHTAELLRPSPFPSPMLFSHKITYLDFVFSQNQVLKIQYFKMRFPKSKFQKRISKMFKFCVCKYFYIYPCQGSKICSSVISTLQFCDTTNKCLIAR